MAKADTPHGTGGNQVIVAHAGGEYSSYAHLKDGSIRVQKGERVRRGQMLAQIGLSGDGFQPHLHFQITESRYQLRAWHSGHLCQRQARALLQHD